MYYLGTAGSVLVNGLRISGASGIYKSHDLFKGSSQLCLSSSPFALELTFPFPVSTRLLRNRSLRPLLHAINLPHPKLLHPETSAPPTIRTTLLRRTSPLLPSHRLSLSLPTFTSPFHLPLPRLATLHRLLAFLFERRRCSHQEEALLRGGDQGQHAWKQTLAGGAEKGEAEVVVRGSPARKVCGGLEA